MTEITASERAVAESTVERAAHGDAAAFGRLVAEYDATMVRVAYVICGEAAAAHDAVQSAWTIAWRRLTSLRDPLQVRSWLVAVAANEARGVLRRQRRRSVVELAVVRDAPSTADPGDRIALLDLHRALAALKPDDRRLLAMRYVAGLTSNEIAAQIGGSPSGVRSRLDRLLDRLRRDLDHA
jgi:RNA polymerase sigma-70 factor (ECF subfamily)